MTKENYQDAIMRMYDFCISSNHPAQIREQFTQDLDFLAKLAEEHFEERAETNAEHYLNDLLKIVRHFCFMHEKVKNCCDVGCAFCTFGKGNCDKERFEWLASPYKKPTYKLSQFEYDLLETYKAKGMRQSIRNYSILFDLNEKGHFKGVDLKATIDEILDNCEVIQ